MDNELTISAQEAFIMDLKSSLCQIEETYFHHPTSDQYDRMVQLQGVLNSELSIMNHGKSDEVISTYDQVVKSKPYESLWK